jgi:hypothetical protein
MSNDEYMTSSYVSKGVLLVLLTTAFSHAQQRPGDALRDEIVAQERSGLDALKIGDVKAFTDSLADDAVFVDSQGPASKDVVVKNVADFRLREYAMSDIRFVALSADSGLLVYRMAENGTSHGKEFAAKVNVSSIWLRRNGRWVCLFSQETAAK